MKTTASLTQNILQYLVIMHTTQGITLIGNPHSNNSYNYSLNVSLYVTHVYESKIISLNLMVKLSQCHTGFCYSSESQKCECYDTGNIVSCSDSNSTIKRGYWFGSVNGKSTVTSCPNDYCNFTCCEITNGFIIFHQLEKTSVDYTGLVLLVVTVRKVIHYH